MSVFLVTGKPRTGKTLLISGLSIMFADQGTEIYSNLDLKKNGETHPNCQIITPYNLVQMMEAGRRKKTGIITIHEIYAFFHSHKALSDINNFGGAFVCQSAKLGYIWLIDSQLVNKVDDNFRALAEYRYEAEKDTQNKQFNYYELDTSITDKDVRTGEYFSIPFELASCWWNRYDTYTPNPIIGLSELKTKMQKLEPKIMNQTINNQVKMILEKKKELGLYFAGDVSTLWVKNALLELEQPLAFADFVALRLKRDMQ